MNILEAKSYVERSLASSNGKKFTPDETINMLKRGHKITLGEVYGNGGDLVKKDLLNSAL